jgi:hypothetical protein
MAQEVENKHEALSSNSSIGKIKKKEKGKKKKKREPPDRMNW